MRASILALVSVVDCLKLLFAVRAPRTHLCRRLWSAIGWHRALGAVFVLLVRIHI